MDQAPEFDAEGVFDEDYLHFYRDVVDSRVEQETELIWRLAGLAPGNAVLDLACGHGRISKPLAARGCRVTGLDGSATFLDVARQESGDLGIGYVHGDMRELPWTGEFDVVLNWFTSFGYFSDTDNRRVLSQAHGALRPGGRLMVELNNLVALLPRHREHSVHESGDDVMIDHHRLDPLTMRSVVERTVVRDGRVRRVPYSVRLLTAPELQDWLRGAGFTGVTFHGEDGEPLTAEHRRMIAVATKA